MSPRLTAGATVLSGRAERLRLGFLGLGWIGRKRMESLLRSGLVEVAAIADPVQEVAEQAKAVCQDAPFVYVDHMEALWGEKLDGLVIATPSALHAEQAIAALESGLAVFCQKPLGRTATETRQVIEAARRADRLLAVDLSYRFLQGMQAIRDLVQAREIGDVYAVDVVFHNAYGPDKAWFYDPAQSGGGCLIDLGLHLVDLALWTLGFPRVTQTSSRMFAQGKRLKMGRDQVEDYAVARLDLDTGAVISLACSWRLPAGLDAVVEVVFYGTAGGLALRNVCGSFYDFKAERFWGTARQTLHEPPDEWGGRAAVAWAHRLADSPQYHAEVEQVVTVAEVVDRLYDL
jgi:predicted dehydrogenase